MVVVTGRSVTSIPYVWGVGIEVKRVGRWDAYPSLLGRFRLLPAVFRKVSQGATIVASFDARKKRVVRHSQHLRVAGVFEFGVDALKGVFVCFAEVSPFLCARVVCFGFL